MEAHRCSIVHGRTDECTGNDNWSVFRTLSDGDGNAAVAAGVGSTEVQRSWSNGKMHVILSVCTRDSAFRSCLYPWQRSGWTHCTIRSEKGRDGLWFSSFRMHCGEYPLFGRDYTAIRGSGMGLELHEIDSRTWHHSADESQAHTLKMTWSKWNPEPYSIVLIDVDILGHSQMAMAMQRLPQELETPKCSAAEAIVRCVESCETGSCDSAICNIGQRRWSGEIIS
jgi:hypothetical protein